MEWLSCLSGGIGKFILRCRMALTFNVRSSLGLDLQEAGYDLFKIFASTQLRSIPTCADVTFPRERDLRLALRKYPRNCSTNIVDSCNVKLPIRLEASTASGNSIATSNRFVRLLLCELYRSWIFLSVDTDWVGCGR